MIENSNSNNTSYGRMAKWSTSTILKFIEAQHWQFVSEVLKDDSLTKEEKNKKIDKWLETFQSIYQPIFEYGLNWKKK